MVCTEFEVVMREHMDYSDRATLRAIAEATDEHQSQMLTALTSKLYDLIVAKADQIDYSTIAKSKGDITKIQNYDQLTECVTLIHNIVVQYKENTTSIDTVSTAIDNLKKRTAEFKKAFAVGSPIPTLLYNNIALSIVNSVSFMIATCIEYVKSPSANTFDIALDTVAYRQTMNHLLFRSLQDFNKGCMNTDFDLALKYCLAKRIVSEAAIEDNEIEDKPFFTPAEIENGEDEEVVIHDVKEKSVNEGFFGDILSGGARALVFIIKCFVPILRGIVYYIYSTRQNISDYFLVQAQMLEMNAYKLQYNNNIDEERRKKAYEKQMKIATKFRNISNKFAIEDSVATKKATEMEKSESKKYDINEIAEEVVNGDDDLF